MRGIISFLDVYDSGASTLTTSLMSTAGAAVAASGSAQLLLSRNGNTGLVFTGCSGACEAAVSSPNGTRAAIVSVVDAAAFVTLPVPPFAFFVVSISGELRAALRSGLTYVSLAVTGGALRGSYPPCYSLGSEVLTAFASGAQQWPLPVLSAAFGIVTVSVDDIVGNISVRVRVDNLVNETAAEIGIGSALEAGTPALTLPASSQFGRSAFSLTASLLAAMRTGRAHVNIRTTAFPAGQ